MFAVIFFRYLRSNKSFARVRDLCGVMEGERDIEY